MRKKLAIAGAAVIGLLVAAVAGVGFLLDANQFRPQLEASMSGALGRSVKIANIRVSLFSGGIAIEGLTIADDPAFSREPFVTAKAMTIGVDLLPLLLSHSLRVESFRLDEPRVVLRRAISGSWNFSSLGAASSGSGRGATATMSVLVQKLRIAGGRVVVGNAGRGDDRVYDDVNVEVTDLSYTSAFPFRVTVATPGGGTASLDGQAGPVNTRDAAETPFHATVDVKQLNLASTGFVDAAAGLAGLIDFSGSLASDGVRMTTKGAVKATKARLLPGARESGVPVVVDYESNYDSKAERGVLKQCDVHVGAAVAHVTGEYSTFGNALALKMTFAGRKMPVTDLEGALPAVGVTLPAGATLKQGTLDSDLTITGPADRLVISGSLNLSGGRLAGFDLGAKLGAIASLAGLPAGGDTVIETLGAAVRVAPTGIQVDSLNMVVPAIGTLSGSGTIAPTGTMNFKMLVKVRGGAVPVVSGGMARAVALSQSNGIPFRIEGTTSNPSFRPDAGAAIESLKSGVSDLIGGLFGGKK